MQLLIKYADPVLDTMDMHKVVKHRLFRESCVYYEGAYVKVYMFFETGLVFIRERFKGCDYHR